MFKHIYQALKYSHSLVREHSAVILYFTICSWSREQIGSRPGREGDQRKSVASYKPVEWIIVDRALGGPAEP